MPTTMKLIGKNVLGSDTASVTFSSIPGTFTDLLLVASTRTDRAAALDYLTVRPNGATTNQSGRYMQGSGSQALSGSITSFDFLNNGNTSSSNTFSSHEIYFPNYAGSTNKSFSVTGVQEDNASAAYIQAVACLWSSTAAITSLTLVPYYGPNFKTGSSFFLYGITKA